MAKTNTSNTYPFTKVMATTVKKYLSEERLNQVATLHRVWSNIRTARHRIRKQSGIIRNFYNQVHTSHNGGFVYEWLPKEQLIWFENKIRHLDKHMKAATMIPILYSSLEIFLSTFEEMLTFDASDQHIAQPSVYLARRGILGHIIDDLKAAILEVKNSIEIFSLQKSVPNVAEIKNTKHWDAKQGHTLVMIQDWGVITVYYKFVKDWEKITKVIFENYCSTVSRTHKCHKALKATDSAT